MHSYLARTVPVHVRIGYEYTWYDYGTKPHTRTLFVPCPPGTNGTRIYIISFRTTFVPDVVRKWYECFVSLDVRPGSYHTRTFQPHSLRLSCFIRPYFVLISSLVGVRGTNRVRIMSLRTNFVPVPGHSYLTRTIAVPYSYSNVHIPSQQCNSCCIRARFVPYPPINSRSNENELGSNLVFGAWNTWNMLEHLDSSQVSQPCSKAVSTWGHLHRSLFAPCHHPAGQFGGIAH